jgi:hypothetical protein
VTAVDYKGRTVLDEPAIQIISLIVSTLRKSKVEDELHTDVEHVRDVLTALTLAGYAVIPQGAIASIKKLIVESGV